MRLHEHSSLNQTEASQLYNLQGFMTVSFEIGQTDVIASDSHTIMAYLNYITMEVVVTL